MHHFFFIIVYNTPLFSVPTKYYDVRSSDGQEIQGDRDGGVTDVTVGIACRSVVQTPLDLKLLQIQK